MNTYSNDITFLLPVKHHDIKKMVPSNISYKKNEETKKEETYSRQKK